MDDWGVRRVANTGAELRTWRNRRKLTLRALASRVHCSFSYLGKIENGQATFTLDIARACDQALDAGGALIYAWKAAQGSVRPAQLPAAPAHLVGRDVELAMLVEGLRHRPPGTPSVAAIDGPAGVGKTALALRLAHQIADEHVDGQLYADLGGFAPPGKSMTAGDVLEGFLSAIGARLIPDTTAERAALYRSLLAERNVLIVLDNVADLADVEQLIPAAASCTVVVTSRRTLASLVTRVSATRIAVRPLSETDSINLVSLAIGTERAAASADAVATVTRLCGHLPLALCVAAERIAMYPHRRVVDLVDELIEEENRLSTWETADLRAALSWSYHRLGDDAARMFRLMGLHRGPHLSVAAVAALAGLPMPQARQLLHQLASLHLVEIDSYQVVRFHELIHAYAVYLVATDNDEQCRSAVQRLVSWYAGTARAASLHRAPRAAEPHQSAMAAESVEPIVSTDDSAARAWCNSELDNFEPIISLALQHGCAVAAHQLATSLADLGLLDRPTSDGAQGDFERTTAALILTPGTSGNADQMSRPEPHTAHQPDEHPPDDAGNDAA